MKTRRLHSVGTFAVAVITLVIMMFPFVMVLLNSFKDRLEIFSNPLSFSGFVGLENYRNAFATMRYFSGITNSIFVTFFSLLVIIVFSSMLAIFLCDGNGN